MSQFIVQQSGISNLIGAPIGLPPFIPSTTQVLPVRGGGELPPPEIPGQGLPRAINYLADYGGCSWYRCMAPNLMLNLYQKAVMLELTTMVLDPRFYAGVKAVKIQRQATPIQRDFVKMLKEISRQMPDGGFKLIYEIDDIVFREDIPDFNRNKDAFVADEIRNSILEILDMCDEITVTCDFMRDYFNEKTGTKKATVIPNYLLKWWFDRYYNLGDLVKNFLKTADSTLDLGKDMTSAGSESDLLGKSFAELGKVADNLTDKLDKDKKDNETLNKIHTLLEKNFDELKAYAHAT